MNKIKLMYCLGQHLYKEDFSLGRVLSLSQQTLHSNNSTSILANPVMEENPGEENGMTQNKYFLSGFGATRSKHFSSHPASAVTPDLN